MSSHGSKASALLANEFKWEFMDLKAMFGKNGPQVRPASVATTRNWKAKKPKVTVNTARCHHSSRTVVETIISRLGWEECQEEALCSLLWTGGHCENEFFSSMMCFQKCNRFPGMADLVSKVAMSKSLRRMKSLLPEQYDFFPDTWILSEDFPRSCRKTTTERDNPTFPVTEFPASASLEAPSCQYTEKGFFILKPDGGSQGEGILLADSIAEFDLPAIAQTCTDDFIIQRYIPNPLLIDGFKFDMRIYVLVTNFDDLKVYRYEEGLGRLCTQKYEVPTVNNFSKQFMHLTNYSLNKQNEDFVYNENPRKFDEGSKRTLAAINKHLRERAFDVPGLWANIDAMIAKTIVAMQPQMWHNYRSCFGDDNTGDSCFQLLGFDVLLDEKCKPWLLEVNHSPSFSCDTPLDTMVKEAVIMDTLKLVNLNVLAQPRRGGRGRNRPVSRARSGSTRSIVAEEWGFRNVRTQMTEKQKQEEWLDRIKKDAHKATPHYQDGSESSRQGGWKAVVCPATLGLMHTQELRTCYITYAGPKMNEMTNAKFYRLLRDYGMLENCRLTRAEVDLIFSDSVRVKKDATNGAVQKLTASHQHRGVLTFPMFVDALTRFGARRFRKGTYAESFCYVLAKHIIPGPNGFDGDRSVGDASDTSQASSVRSRPSSAKRPSTGLSMGPGAPRPRGVGTGGLQQAVKEKLNLLGATTPDPDSKFRLPGERRVLSGRRSASVAAKG